ncbi:EamA family transporter [Tenacibaculum sp. SZ-18]|uniref:DMT family transporter n=1 Tax=Tenacibaculum sp. SZ-18 TaxID=754423 RepID=UPI000C2D0273|nr:DMT family transporter [Tenacibaculum sp. SZ-18]AUC16909.1 EamA family transporter [Tenacibaculum sp. SZ-18]
MNTRVLALAAVSIVTIIYGVTFTVAKEVMPHYVKPFGFIFIRVSSAMLIFWLASLFIKNDKVEKGDYKLIALAAFFGIAFNMLTFFKGLNYTTPINASVMMVTSPILVLIFSSIIMKERPTIIKILGVIIGLVGAVILILYSGSSSGNATNMMLGNFLVFVNAASYGMYLVVAKKIVGKYKPITFIRWLYLFGFIFMFPFGISEFTEIQWDIIPTSGYLRIGFVVIFASCITYLFNLWALSKLKPTTVSVFIYLQPVVASIYALIVGSDYLDTIKISATILIFIGVYLVSKQASTSKSK